MTNPRTTKTIYLLLGVLGVSLLVGILVPLILPSGTYILSWLATFILLFIVLALLILIWQGAGGGKQLLWMMVLAFSLRLVLGIFLSWGLPLFGYAEESQQGGYLFYDAFRRDVQSWELASSGASLFKAFSGEFTSDQYGGLLMISALIYRLLSPDAHRPYLMIILGAGASALGVPFIVAALRRKFNEKTAILGGWMMALYPESLLLGSSQMREPFLIALFALTFWGVITWFEKDRPRRDAVLAIFIGLIGLFLFSSRVAIPVLGAILVCFWLDYSGRSSKKWLQLSGWFVIGATALVIGFLSWGWLREAIHWDTLLTIRNSGWVEFALEKVPEWVKTPFVIIYGLFQPVLPAAIVDPAPWIWRSIGILRGIGWYAMLPFIIYGFFGVWRVEDKSRRRLLVWLAVIVWGWIVLSSARAGGDQWDNPRYRTIFLPWMATLAAWAISWVKAKQDRWLGRWLIIEGIFLGFFTEWYISRYYSFIGNLPFWLMVVLIIVLSAGVLIGGWLWDRKHPRFAHSPDP